MLQRPLFRFSVIGLVLLVRLAFGHHAIEGEADACSKQCLRSMDSLPVHPAPVVLSNAAMCHVDQGKVKYRAN